VSETIIYSVQFNRAWTLRSELMYMGGKFSYYNFLPFMFNMNFV